MAQKVPRTSHKRYFRGDRLQKTRFKHASRAQILQKISCWKFLGLKGYKRAVISDILGLKDYKDQS